MNQVQQLRQRFEKLKIPEKELNEVQKLSPKQNGPMSPFKRSKTSLEIIRNCDKNTNHDNSESSFLSKCLKRSPAFRFNQDRTRASVHSHPSSKSAEKKNKNFPNIQDELQYVSTSETIKRALLKPLPIGLPPKKPPRIFNNGNETSSSVSSSSTPNKEVADDEVIYMEPFAHLKMSPSPVKEPQQLHYMCTDLDTGQSRLNNSNNSNRRLSTSAHLNDSSVNEKNSIEKVRNVLREL
jgi:hypothetical protein